MANTDDGSPSIDTQVSIRVERETVDLLHKISMLPPQALTRALRIIELGPDSYELRADPAIVEREWMGLVDRFMTHVDAESSPAGCWVWQAAVGDMGYGFFSIGWKKGYRAHRAAWLLFRGAIPPGLQVLHRCDNRPCVNPDHLSLGTHAENMADRLQKGRTPKGGGKKLTNAQVIEIRELYATGGYSLKQLSQKFGVNPRSISGIVNRKKWIHV